ERGGQLRRREPAAQQAEQHALAGRLIGPILEARALKILHRMHLAIRELLVDLFAEWQPEDRQPTLAFPYLLEAKLDDVLGLRKIASILGIGDRSSRGEDPVANCLAPQQPKLDGGRVELRPLEARALEILVDAIGPGVDILLGHRVSEDRQPTTLIPEIAKDAANIVAGRAHIE